MVIPTRHRPGYLAVALESLTAQARAAGAEVIVVCDGEDPATASVAETHRVRLVTLPAPVGANAARNAGVAAAGAELIAFLDDDVRVDAGWMQALLHGVRNAPEHDVFGGPIRARLEGGGPRACGREPAPITHLEAGEADHDVAFVWSANMAVRRRAWELVGPFDETVHGRGEEEEWLRRYAAAGGRVRYLAAAAIEHRRTAEDARLPALTRAAYALGITARRWDARKGAAPSVRAELRVLAGCAWHTLRRRCAIGVVMGAHAAGRVREALRTGPPPPSPSRDDFLSGESGEVSGIRATTRAVLADARADVRAFATAQGPRLDAAAAAVPPRRVLAVAVERPEAPNLLASARAELLRSHHHVEVVTGAVGGRGKFENLRALIDADRIARADWLIVLDDDVALPAGFLDRFLFLAERFDLRIAQPAHRFRSHAGWRVTRRTPGGLVRETAFVEIGPLTAFAAETFPVLLPFPPLRAGWGLDAHWAAIARERGWRIGVVDATPITHLLRPVAAAYAREAAISEARAFLAERAYVRASEAQRTLAAHRSWR